MNYTKADYNYMASLRRAALIQIAQKLGNEHTITKMMGCMAYGRNEVEQGPEGNLRTAIREKEFLDGCVHILKVWARDNDVAAQMVITKLYPTGYTSRP